MKIFNNRLLYQSKIYNAGYLCPLKEFCTCLKNLFIHLKSFLLERPVSIRPLSLNASEMLAMQKNLLEKSAAELLRTDLLHMSTKEFNTHKDYPPGSFVLVHKTGAPPSRLQHLLDQLNQH